MYTLECDEADDKLVYTVRDGEKLGRWQSEKRGIQVPHAMTAREALTLARVDSTFVRRPSFTHSTDGQVIPCDGQDAVVRDLRGKSMFVPRAMVGADYTIRQPIDTLERFIGDQSVLTVCAGLETMEVYAQASLDPIYVAAPGGRDEVKGHLTFLLTFAGVKADRIGVSSTRAVCENTLTHSTLGLAKVRHNLAGERKMGMLADIYREAVNRRAEEERIWNALAATRLSENDAHEVIKSIWPGDSTRSDTRRDTAMARYLGAGTGADLAGQTAWGLYQAVTEDLRDRSGVRDGDQVDAWLYNELSDASDNVRTRAMQPLMVLAGIAN